MKQVLIQVLIQVWIRAEHCGRCEPVDVGAAGNPWM